MPDTLLIDKVVERGLFEDMAKIAAHYGTESLRRSANAFASKNPASVSEQLPHLRRGSKFKMGITPKVSRLEMHWHLCN